MGVYFRNGNFHPKKDDVFSDFIATFVTSFWIGASCLAMLRRVAFLD